MSLYDRALPSPGLTLGTMGPGGKQNEGESELETAQREVPSVLFASYPCQVLIPAGVRAVSGGDWT